MKHFIDINNFKKFKIVDNNYLLNYDWPGNVRELRNLIERIAILQPDTKEKISSFKSKFKSGFARLVFNNR